MYRFITKRLIMLIPVILGVTFLVYFILSLSPGDPAMLILADQYTPEAGEELREKMGLNDPIIKQYFTYMFKLVKGDMGKSYINGRSVINEIKVRIPHTFKLTVVGILFSVCISLPIGIISAVKQYSLMDNVSMVITLLVATMPGFWLGLMLIIIFALKLGVLPSGGADTAKSIILPAVTVGLSTAASITRMTRSSMLEVVRQDYVRTAKAKGVNKRIVILKHALKNALIPIVTVVGIQFGGLMGGAIIAETVFAWPGVGRLMIDSIRAKDTPIVLGCIVIFAVLFSLINLLIDILYGFIDPRIKAKYKG